MSFFEDASLVLIPSGIKNQKIYSIKPTDGTGDLTFTRASSATRVGPNGYIEKVRTNVTLYSEELSNVNWTKISTNVTSNAATAPDGTTTADKLVPNTGNSNKMIYNLNGNLTSVGDYSLSVYVKAAGYSKVGLRESQSVGYFATFDLSNGTILDSSSDQVNTITSVGDGWYRITSTRSFTGSVNIGILPLDNSYTSGQPFSYSYIGDGTSGILAWGAQTEHGVPTEYIKTEAAAVSVGPVSGTPRLDYLGSDCGRLLLEPQRSNLLTFSEQMTNGVYGKGNGIAITDNATPSPDGYTNADKIYTNTTAGGDHYFNRSPFTSISSSTAYTFSVFAKKAEFKYISVEATIENNSYKSVTIDLSNGNLSSNTFAQTPKVEDYGNGWYRISVFGTSGAAQTSADTYIIVRNDSLQRVYTGDGTSGIYTWGWQLEAGAYPSSYVPTLGTAVTRVAETSITASITSLIGQTEGVFYLEISLKNPPADNSYVFLRNAAVTDYLGLRIQGGNLRFETVDNSVLQTAINYIANTPQTVKVAMAYKLNDFVMYVNGTQVGTDTSATVPTCDILDLNFNAPSVNSFAISQALLFKTRLTNAQLAELTSL